MITGFHDGELAMQLQAGVQEEAARLVGMLAPPHLGDGIRRFLGERTFAALTGRDSGGRMWVSPLTGPPGFLDGSGTTLWIRARPRPGDPLADLVAGQPVGLLVIEFATRRRLRVNGTLTGVGADGLEVDVVEAFGNCPRYIQQRDLEPSTPGAEVTASAALNAEQAALIRRADTFVFGTVHPERGADASHRGGTPGFVRVEGQTVWWPDYPGNNMFNSLGNLAVDDTAALLFADFTTGATVQLSGTAAVEWVAPGSPGDDGGTGRRVRFTVERVVGGAAVPHGSAAVPYRHNPPITDAAAAGTTGSPDPAHHR